MAEGPGTRTLSVIDAAARSGSVAVAPCLFLALESHRPLAPPLRLSLANLDEVVVGRGARAASRSDGARPRRMTLQVDDAWMSTRHVRFGKVLGQWTIEDLGSKNGSRVNGAPVTRAPLADGDLVELGRTFFVWRAELPVPPDEPEVLDATALRPPAPGFATLLPELSRAYADLAAIARAEVPVLVQGETGTGKEVTARALHVLSGRRGDLVAVNCGALPEALVEGELFGHRRGAFSDAKEDRPGLVRAADGGTLFLDEIGDLRLPAQTALLRVLEGREVRPIGATAAVRVDVRFVAATHRPLERMVEEGGFRADLFHRLAGHRIELPSLRDRREDLGLLLAAILQKVAPAEAARAALHPAAARALFGYRFPGNVRELEKAIGAAIVLARGGEVEVAHLPLALQRSGEGEAVEAREEIADDGEGAARREELVALFQQHKGNVSAVARAMGKARMQIQRWMKRYGIDPESYKR
jgi:transcriptional regulator of acetoin/glycerol metabolism